MVGACGSVSGRAWRGASDITLFQLKRIKII